MLTKLMQSKKHWKMLTFVTPEECKRNSLTIPAFGLPELAPV